MYKTIVLAVAFVLVSISALAGDWDVVKEEPIKRDIFDEVADRYIAPKSSWTFTPPPVPAPKTVWVRDPNFGAFKPYTVFSAPPQPQPFSYSIHSDGRVGIKMDFGNGFTYQLGE